MIEIPKGVNFSDFDEKSKDKLIKGMVDRIGHLENKLNEVIKVLNFVSTYYEGKGDYAGHIAEYNSLTDKELYNIEYNIGGK